MVNTHLSLFVSNEGIVVQCLLLVEIPQACNVVTYRTKYYIGAIAVIADWLSTTVGHKSLLTSDIR